MKLEPPSADALVAAASDLFQRAGQHVTDFDISRDKITLGLVPLHRNVRFRES